MENYIIRIYRFEKDNPRGLVGIVESVEGERETEMSDVPEGGEPCWKIMDCPTYVREKCSAYLYPEGPCWEVAYTQCEVLTSLTKECTRCKVYRLHQKCEMGS